VSLAAQIDGVSIAAAVVEPETSREWTALRGVGSWRDGVELRVSDATKLDMALISTGFAYRAERRERQAAGVAKLLPKVRDIRRPGSASLDLCSVAAGWADGYFEHGLSRWDWAGGALVAEEAGAVVHLPNTPNALGPDLTFCTTPGIADQLSTALKEAGLTDEMP
jgi:myo-inositol-1(or 4)-monophosphatase